MNAQDISNFPEASKQAVNQRVQEVKRWASGATDLPTFAETQSDFSFSEARQAAEAALGAVEGDPDNPDVRNKANYALALYRDMQYLAMGRKRMFQLGVHDGLRELYEANERIPK